MARPLLQSKYRIPGHRPGTVARPRLVEALDGALRAAVTMVSAPAGFGKSTLLAEWLADLPRGRRPPWRGCRWTSATTTPRASGATPSPRSRRPPASATTRWGCCASSPSSPETALVALLNDVGGMPRELVLVLDDLHLVTSPAVHDGIAFLLEHRVDQLHLVLATRVDPPLPLARWRARGELLEVRAADLRFTEQESAAYLNGPMGLSLSEHDVATLDGRAEGWIAALQLAALSMRGRDDVGAFIAGFAGDDRHVVDYLAEEVLARLPEDVRELPARDVDPRTTHRAALRRRHRPRRGAGPGSWTWSARTCSWCRSTTVGSGTATTICSPTSCARTSPTSARTRCRSCTGGRVSGSRSAVTTSAAVEHALAGGHDEQAAELMERAMPAMRRERREAELGQWVRSLPDELVRVRPVLGMAFVGALAQASEFDTVEQRLAEVERAVRPDGGPWPAHVPPGLVVVDEEGYRSVPAGLEVYRAALALRRGDLDDAAAHAREGLALTPRVRRPHPGGRGRAWRARLVVAGRPGRGGGGVRRVGRGAAPGPLRRRRPGLLPRPRRHPPDAGTARRRRTPVPLGPRVSPTLPRRSGAPPTCTSPWPGP